MESRGSVQGSSCIQITWESRTLELCMYIKLRTELCINAFEYIYLWN